MGGATGTYRTVRSVLLAALSALLTGTGHVAGGGSVSDLELLIVLTPFLAGVYGTLPLSDPARRSASTPGTAVGLGAGQFALHHLLVLLHAGAEETDGPIRGGWTMLAAHTLVTLLLTVTLRWFDRGVAAVMAALRRALPRRVAPLPATAPVTVVPIPSDDVSSRVPRMLAAAVGRRGPPVGR